MQVVARALQNSVVGGKFLRNTLCPRCVGVRLEGGAFEKFVVTDIIKGICRQAFSLLLHMYCRNGRYQARIKPARQQSTYGHIAHKLALYSVAYEPPYRFYGILIAVEMCIRDSVRTGRIYRNRIERRSQG